MIPAIRKLARAIRRSEQVELKLTQEEVNGLRLLAATPEWRLYQRLLEQHVEYRGEAMLTTKRTTELHYLRGFIVGLREASLYVERIVAQETHVPRDTSAAKLARRAAALYATPAWHTGVTNSR